jgi:hypothetical protein
MDLCDVDRPAAPRGQLDMRPPSLHIYASHSCTENARTCRCAGGDHGDEHEVTPGLAPPGRMLVEARSILGAEGYMMDGRPGPGPGRVRFTGTADIEGLLADAPGVRAALLEEGVPATAFRVVADEQLTILDINGHPYIRFATATGGDPVAVELPSGRVVEMVTRHHPPPETIVNIALYNTSLSKSMPFSLA